MNQATVCRLSGLVARAVPCALFGAAAAGKLTDLPSAVGWWTSVVAPPGSATSGVPSSLAALLVAATVVADVAVMGLACLHREHRAGLVAGAWTVVAGQVARVGIAAGGSGVPPGCPCGIPIPSFFGVDSPVAAAARDVVLVCCMYAVAAFVPDESPPSAAGADASRLPSS